MQASHFQSEAVQAPSTLCHRMQPRIAFDMFMVYALGCLVAVLSVVQCLCMPSVRIRMFACPSVHLVESRGVVADDMVTRS